MTVFRGSMRLLGSCSQEFHSCSRAVSMRPPIFCAGVSSVELGADCEVAVADVSFMAMAGAPGASRALSTTIGRLIEPFTRPLNEREKEIAPRGHHEPAEPRKRKKEGRKATSQKQNNPRIFNGSNISNISNISNRYSGCIGSQMLLSGAKVSILQG